MSWLSKLMPSGIRTDNAANRKRSVPEGLWEKCDRCGAVLYRPELEENLEVCPKCDFHMPIRARARLASLFDPGSTTEIAATPGADRRAQVQGLQALRRADQVHPEVDRRVRRAGGDAGPAQGPAAGGQFVRLRLHGRLDGLGGGREVHLAAEKALEIGAPFVNFSASGGARMQESLFSLMQMAKTSAALGRLRARPVCRTSRC